MGELPAQVGSNLQILAGLQSQLQTEEDALNTATTAAGLSGNAGQSVSLVARYAQERRRHHGDGLTGDR